MRSKNTRYYLAIVAVIVIAFWQVALFRHLLLWDQINATFPNRFYATECIRSGFLPAWLPYQFTGIPFFTDPQSGTWYPITWIVACLHRYNFFLLNLEFISTIIIGGSGMFILAKKWTEDNSSALFSAICYSCCGIFVSNAEHLTILISAAWLPWLLWCYYQMVQKNELKYVAAVALILFMMATGGYPGILIITLYVLIIIFIALLFKQAYRQKILVLIKLHVILAILCAGCFSILFYTFTKGLGESTRGSGVSLEQALIFPFSPGCFSSFFAPFASFKNTEITKVDVSMTNGYFGLLGLAMLLLGFLQKKDEKYWLVGSISLLCLFAAVGDALPVREFMFKHIPLFNSFRFPSLFRVFFIIGFLLLSAVSFKNLKDDFAKWKKHLVIIISILIVGYISYSATLISNPDISKIDWHKLFFNRFYFNQASTYYQHLFIHSAIQILILITLLAIIIRSKTQLNTRLLLLLCIFDMVVSVQLNMYGTVAGPGFLKEANERVKQSPKGFPLPDNATPILNYPDESFYWEFSPLAGNALTFKKIIGIGGNSPFILKRYDQFIKSNLTDSVWHNPPAYFANTTSTVTSATGLNNKRDVLLSETDAINTTGKYYPAEKDDSVAFSGFGPNKMTLHTRSSGNRLLVLLQNNVSDWKVTIDNKASSWVAANITYMAVLVPRGDHQVTFEIDHKKELIIWLISVAFIVTCIAIIIKGNIKKA